MKTTNPSISVLRRLTAIDECLIIAGWDACAPGEFPHDPGDEIRVKFLAEFRQFLNRWTDISSEYCQRLNVSDSPLSTK